METTAPTCRLIKKYDFSGLEDGIYWYSVKMNKESTTKRLETKDGNPEVMDIRKYIEPTFTFEDKVLKLSYLNPQREESNIYIHDLSGKLLYEAELGSDFAIHKVLDFTSKKSDIYSVIVSNNMEIYEYTVSVE